MSLQYKPQTACQYLKRHDPVMADLIARVGKLAIEAEAEFEHSPFEALLRAIVSVSYTHLTLPTTPYV